MNKEKFLDSITGIVSNFYIDHKIYKEKVRHGICVISRHIINEESVCLCCYIFLDLENLSMIRTMPFFISTAEINKSYDLLFEIDKEFLTFYQYSNDTRFSIAFKEINLLASKVLDFHLINFKALQNYLKENPESFVNFRLIIEPEQEIFEAINFYSNIENTINLGSTLTAKRTTGTSLKKGEKYEVVDYRNVDNLVRVKEGEFSTWYKVSRFEAQISENFIFNSSHEALLYSLHLTLIAYLRRDAADSLGFNKLSLDYNGPKKYILHHVLCNRKNLEYIDGYIIRSSMNRKKIIKCLIDYIKMINKEIMSNGRILELTKYYITEKEVSKFEDIPIQELTSITAPSLNEVPILSEEDPEL